MGWWRGRKGNGLTADLWQWAGQIEHAAWLAQRRADEARGLTKSTDSRPIRPVGGALRRGGETPDPGVDLSALYDPDQAARQNFYIPAEEFAKHAYVPTKGADREWLDPPVPHRLQLMEAVRENGRLVYRPKVYHVRTAKALADLAQTKEYRAAKFLEATGSWMSGSIAENDYKRFVCHFREAAIESAVRPLRETAFDDFQSGEGGSSRTVQGWSVTTDIDQEYVPIVGGPYYRQLYLYAHWEQTSKAFEMKNHSELARACIEIVSDFTLGRGVTWKVKNPRVRDIWREFWTRNDMERRLRVWSDDLTWQGELLIRKYEELRGYLNVRSLDPGSFYEIVTDPADVDRVFLYHLQTPSAWQLPYTTLKGNKLNVPLMQYMIQQFGPDEIFHLKSNVSSTEKWGRSDFFAALGTLKRHRDWSNAATLKDLLQCNLVWKIKVTGDESDVAAFLSNPSNATLPAFGGTWVENTALELSALHEDVAAAGSRAAAGNTGSFLTALFATSQQMPVSYFNVMGAGPSRATALVQSEPFVKKIATRQMAMRTLLDHIFESVMTAAVKGGRLDPAALRYEDADPEWVFPTLYEEDRGAKFQALMAARQEKVISHRTEALQMAQELSLNEYEYEDEQAEIQSEQNNPLLNPPPPPASDPMAALMGGGGPAPPQAPSPAPPQAPAALAALGRPGGTGIPPAPGAPKPRLAVHEQLHGAGERAGVRQNQRQAERPLDARDLRFLEAALGAGQSGAIQLPSGRRVVVRDGPRT